ncbi:MULTISPECIES: PRD domain-containing protein [Pectobacterium]|uniref:PRD domain-containing protein n=1 Tax=Pectobacterium TaxID=122277 RepID=UPI00057C98E4|nr:PRD domain-containing protein [Pectobacterium brasiliense]KHS67306.1 transcription antiterminator BglG [Pectobacterium brasiliense]MBN3144854.1 PRD domain-containing protein [Pectobacterium brasiliense]MDG0804418.1 PRD domain-containing protein [Pectobacterium brasiliense]
MIKVKKALNNSMLLVDHEQQEMILFGKGIGFGAKPGSLIDVTHVEQVFIPLENLKSRHFLSLTDTIPAAFFDITHEIVTLAQSQYAEKLNSVLFFTLAEHLYFAVERSKTGNHFINKLSWEVKRYYQKEYALGVQAKDRVSARFNVTLPDDEAINIAFHLINAAGSAEIADAHQQVQLVNRLAEIVRYKLNKNIDVNAVDYLRFITHLRYFSERVIARKIAPGRTDDFYQELLKHYPEAMAISWAIRDYVQEKYQMALPKEELTWLTMHISRLAESQTP